MNNLHLSRRASASLAVIFFCVPLYPYGHGARGSGSHNSLAVSAADSGGFKLLASIIAGGIVGQCIGKFVGDMDDVFEVVSGFKSSGIGIGFGIIAAMIAFFIMTLIKELTSRFVGLLFKEKVKK